MNFNKQLILSLMVIISLGLAQSAFADSSTAWDDATSGELSYSGNVGIGTTAPGAKLHIISGSGAIYLLNNDTGRGDLLRFFGVNGMNFGFNAYGGGSELIGDIGINYSINSDNGTQRYARIGSKKAPIIRLNGDTGDIEFYGESGSGSNYRSPVLNLGIVQDSTGNVGIGTTTPTNPLHVVGNGYFTGTVTTGSSRSLKKGIESLSEKEAISALQKLKPVKFCYKADDKEQNLGFIAEDVPELVARKDRKSLSAMDLVTLSIKVIQEQQKEIDLLKKAVADLSNNKI